MRTIHCLLIILLFTTRGFSQQLRLQDAVNIALKNSLDIQVVKNNLQISTINNNIGVAGGLPLVTGTASNNEQITNVNQQLNNGTIIQRDGALANSLNAGITGSILLYNGLRVVATKKRLEEIEKQSEEYVNSQVQNTMAAVMTAYFDVIRQQSYTKAITYSIDAAQKKLDIVRAQQNAGMANNADLYQARLDLNTLLQTKQSQQLVTDQSKTELLRIMGVKSDSTVTVEDTILVDRSLTLDATLNSIHRNADIIAADYQVHINEQIVKETAARRYPSLQANAGINYGRNQTSAGNLLLNQSYGPFIGLGLAVPIYNGSVYKRQQKIAEINIRNAEVQKDILLRDYKASIVKNFQSYASNQQQLETQQRNLDLARQLVDLVLQRFQLRQATIIEVTLAQQSYENAAYSLVNYNFAAKAAEIELKRLSNQLSY
jgi:outer membrane protein TolC